jgi:hypothetical protein
MALFNKQAGQTNVTQEWVAEPGLVPWFDFGRHALCDVPLGEPFVRLRSLGPAEGGLPGSEGEYEYYGLGLGVGTRKGRCASFSLYFAERESLTSKGARFAPFPGRCVLAGERLELSASTSEADFVARFGEPYWRDVDDDERLLFYEFGGDLEWQVEFDEQGHLACMLAVTPPLLAREEQRKAYQVTRPWPP